MSSAIICPHCEKAFQAHDVGIPQSGAPFYDPEFREKVAEQMRPLFSMAEIEAITQKMMADGLILRSVPEVTFYVGQKPSEDKCQD